MQIQNYGFSAFNAHESKAEFDHYSMSLNSYNQQLRTQFENTVSTPE